MARRILLTTGLATLALLGGTLALSGQIQAATIAPPPAAAPLPADLRLAVWDRPGPDPRAGQPGEPAGAGRPGRNAAAMAPRSGTARPEWWVAPTFVAPEAHRFRARLHNSANSEAQLK
jgi:ABC-type transport system substrate-binding protein